MPSPQTIARIVYHFVIYMTFILANLLLLIFPYYATTSALWTAAIVAAPVLLWHLSIIAHTVVPTNKHLECGLFMVFIGCVNVANYTFSLRDAIATWPTLSALGAGLGVILAFFALEAVYFRVNKYICDETHSYNSFRDQLHQFLGKIGLAVLGFVSGLTSDFVMSAVRRCGLVSEGNHNSEDAGGHRTETQAVLPPPYWTNMPPITPSTGTSAKSDLVD